METEIDDLKFETPEFNKIIDLAKALYKEGETAISEKEGLIIFVIKPNESGVISLSRLTLIQIKKLLEDMNDFSDRITNEATNNITRLKNLMSNLPNKFKEND